MASIAIAAIAGCAAGGGITGIVSWFTGGDHDTYGKGAKVYYVEPTWYISLDNIDGPKVFKDESSSFIHLPKMQWTTELVIVAICAGILIHLLGGIWGWLGGKKHQKESSEKEHAVRMAELKMDHAKDLGDYLSEQAKHKEMIRNLREQLSNLKKETEKKVSTLADQHAAETVQHETEIKVAHAALAKLVHAAPSEDDDDDDDDFEQSTQTLGRASRRDSPGAQGGSVPRSTSVPAAARQKKKKKIPIEEYLQKKH